MSITMAMDIPLSSNVTIVISRANPISNHVTLTISNTISKSITITLETILL